MSLRVLIVDDSEGYTRLAHRFLRRYEYATNCDLQNPCWECEYRRECFLKHAHNWKEVGEIFDRHGGDIDVVLLDVNFDIAADELVSEDELLSSSGGADARLRDLRRFQGFHILRRLRRRYGQVPVVLMTSNTAIAFNEEAIAADLANEEYTQLFEDGEISAQSLAAKIERARRMAEEVKAEDGTFFWGTSRTMVRLRRWIEVVAQGDQPILILGETGTGKSFIAEQVIHEASRPGSTFCAIDLSTIPDNLLAAELFGTAKGAYSGAVSRAGRFEFADGGTLFLDEVGNLSLELQKQLLTVIQDRRVTRLGENKPRPVDVKLVVATNEDLEERVRDGAFRVDLYQRLNPAAKVVLPPLRARKEDLRGLCAFLLKRVFDSPGNARMLHDFARLFGIDGGRVRPGLTFSPRLGAPSPGDSGRVWFQLAGLALKEFQDYDFPGNTRELEMILANALLFSLADALAAGRVSERPVVTIDVQVLRGLIAASDLSRSSADEVSSSPEDTRCIVSLKGAKSLNALSREVERQIYEDLYVRCGGSFERVAALLLEGSGATHARKVQLRFNNLGLSVRSLRDRFPK